LPLLQAPQFREPGLIIVGPVKPADPRSFCAAVATLAKALQWPVLADVLSPLRHSSPAPEALITTYDLILRHPPLAAQLVPQQVIQIGELPTSKELRQWLAQAQPQRWIVDPSAENLDPLHGPVLSVRCDLEIFQDWVFQRAMRHAPTPAPQVQEAQRRWLDAEHRIQSLLYQTLTPVEQMSEPKLAWALAHWLPRDTPVFIANSTPVRDWEWFCMHHDRELSIFFNRGANGIDGTLSTALGIAHGESQGAVLVTGDLALLHDTNGFLLHSQFQGHLTIVLINNDGGGIFELLPLADFEPPFESLFATPQSLDFRLLCQTYGIEYQAITTWGQLRYQVQSLPNTGIRLLEVRTDRKADAQWRRDFFAQLVQEEAP
ncbi:MAG: 2-succinyl-5-enolpyruvyl-6-hydroxy-3-cyclohexene-1-carboxylate synthase, partial [Prochlorothrix sp.]